MKELLTKRFWQDVKKTFDEAREDPSPEGSNSQIPAAGETSEKSRCLPKVEPVDDGDTPPVAKLPEQII